MNDPKGGVAKVTCPTFEAMGQIPAFHRTYFLLLWHRVICHVTSNELSDKTLVIDIYHFSTGFQIADSNILQLKLKQIQIFHTSLKHNYS